MKRLRWPDVVLLATLLPVWGAWFAFQARWVLGGSEAWLPIFVAASAPPGSHPVVTGIAARWKGSGGLALGDELLRFGEADLSGVGPTTVLARALEETGSDRRLATVIRRGGEERALVLDLDFPRLWDAGDVGGGGESPRDLLRATWLVTTFLFTVVAVLVLLRAPRAPAARPLFVALLLAPWTTGYLGPGPRELIHGMNVLRAFGTLTLPFGLIALRRIPESVAPPPGRDARWPWLLLVGVAPIWWSTMFGVPFSAAFTFHVAYPIEVAVCTASALGVITRNFVHADPRGRRQIKWVLYGVYLAEVPLVVMAALWLLRVRGSWLVDLANVLPLLWVASPVCFLIAIARYNLFDIDRLISATASYTVLGIGALAAALAVVPRASAAMSAATGVDSAWSQVLLSVALAAVVVPAQRRLRPQIDRVLFAERWAFERGIDALLRALSGCPDPETLFRRTGEGLDALLRPDACVVYARAAETYSPVFVRGRAVASVFDARSPLVTTLARRPAPLAAERWAGPHATAGLDPFDRAVLETLGVAVVLPIAGREAPIGFVCLGEKRSGDVYTSTDLALLGAVADKVGVELLRFDDAEIVRRSHAMQDALRRYVPAPVASRLTAGQALEPAERDVTVVFVDLRGYTRFSESRVSEEIFSTVNRYTEVVSGLIREHGGAVVEFNGDGMMAVFGAPDSLPHKERAAVEAARRIVDAVAALPPARAGEAALAVGVGIATGPAFVGNVRAVDRLIWTAIGNTPNLAARLQQLTRDLGGAIVIDAPTWHAARYVAADFRRRERVPIRGRSDPQDVYLLASGRQPT